MLKQVASLNDKEHYSQVNDAMKVIGFQDYADTFWRVVAAVLHLVCYNCSNCFLYINLARQGYTVR